MPWVIRDGIPRALDMVKMFVVGKSGCAGLGRLRCPIRPTPTAVIDLTRARGVYERGDEGDTACEREGRRAKGERHVVGDEASKRSNGGVSASERASDRGAATRSGAAL